MPYPKPNIKNQQSPQKYFHYSYGILHDSFETYFFAKYKESRNHEKCRYSTCGSRKGEGEWCKTIRKANIVFNRSML